LGSDPDFTWNSSSNVLTIGDDLSIGNRAGNDNDNLYFDQKNEYLRWNNSAGRFEFSDDVAAQAFYYTSDKNLKTNIQNISDALDKILKLQGVTFQWKDTGKTSIGLVAQEVEKIFPEVVEGPEGLKTIDYGRLVAPLIEAIKAQQEEIERLEQRIEKLENLIDTLTQ
jgi:hypothetical protein